MFERGNIRLIGATTENPSFEINGRAALALPRLHPEPALRKARWLCCCAARLEDSERGLGKMGLRASDEILQQIAAYTSGDARSSIQRA